MNGGFPHKVNDVVVYGTDGVCRITEITKKPFRDREVTYYVLKPLFKQSSTIFVPVDCEKLTAKMHKALSSDEILALIQSLPDQDTMWIEDEAERKVRYKEILLSGDRLQLIRMIKALYFHQEEQRAVGKKLHISDDNFFKEAQRLLHDEFSAALGIPRDEILNYIDQIIAEASDQKE
ncbi:MAG: CarD family transcriptional regulator [Lachnospiraceae bacterium]|nr:CarD family transcriptional regulator [Lachnospiraceae bacterium]